MTPCVRLHSPSRATGFSLIELLLVLGVLAILLVAAFVVYPQVRDRSQAQTEAENIRAIQSSVRSLFAMKGGNYEGLGRGRSVNDRGIANQARIFPVRMNDGDYSQDAVIRSTWGGEVYVWRNPDVVTPRGSFPWGYTFGILYQDVPPGVCIQLLPSLVGGFHSVKINSIEVSTASGELDAEALGRACAQRGSLVLTSI